MAAQRLSKTLVPWSALKNLPRESKNSPCRNVRIITWIKAFWKKKENISLKAFSAPLMMSISCSDHWRCTGQHQLSGSSRSSQRTWWLLPNVSIPSKWPIFTYGAFPPTGPKDPHLCGPNSLAIVKPGTKRSHLFQGFWSNQLELLLSASERLSPGGGGS